MYKETKVYYEVDEKKSVERNRYILLRHLTSQALVAETASRFAPPPSFMTNQSSSQNIPSVPERICE
jgi:hypothetical protein